MAGRLQQEKVEVLQKRRPVQRTQGVLRKAAPETAENEARRAEEVRAEGRSRSAGGPSWPAEGHEGDALLEEARHGLRHQRESFLLRCIEGQRKASRLSYAADQPQIG